MSGKTDNVSWIVDNLLSKLVETQAIVFHTEDYIYGLVHNPGTSEWQEIILTTSDGALEVNKLDSNLAIMKLIEEVNAQETYDQNLSTLINPVKLKAAVDKLAGLSKKENATWVTTFLQVKEKSIAFLHSDSIYALAQVKPAEQKWQDAIIMLNSGDLAVSEMDSLQAIIRLKEQLLKVTTYDKDFALVHDQATMAKSIKAVKSI